MNTRNASRSAYLISRMKRSGFRMMDGATLTRHAIAAFSRFSARFALVILLAGIFLSTAWSDRVFSRGSATIASTESVNLFASSALTTPKIVFNLGETAWALEMGAPLPSGTGFRQRRFQWVAPDGTVTRQSDITMDAQSDSYQIPASAQVGTWVVKTVDNSGVGFAVAEFVVRDPNPANATADLSVNIIGPFQVTAGASVTYALRVTNNGPEDAQSVELVDSSPEGAILQSIGSPQGWDCATSGGTTTCTRASLARGASALFTIIYQLDADTPVDTTISTTADVSSQTTELRDPDNSSTATSTVVASACTLGCPSNVTQANDAGMNGATVNYADPTSSQNCSNVVCNPPSGSFFPAGVTTVVCSSENGGHCSFTVTVTGAVAIAITGTNPLTVECHSEFQDPGATAQNGNGDAVPVTSSGTVDMNTPGLYTITYTATEGSFTATATRTVEVVDSTPPAITACAPNKTLTANSNNQAVIPNLIGEISASDNCTPAPLVITQSPAAGTVVGIGSAPVTITVTDTAGNFSTCIATVAVPVDLYLHGTGPNNNPPTLFLNNVAPAATNDKFKDSPSVNFNGGNPWKEVGEWDAAAALPAGTLTSLDDLHVWLGLKNSDDQGTRFDLRAEVYKNGLLVAAGETYCITGVTRNPAQAKEVAVTFAPFEAITLNGASDTLTLKVLTRIGSDGAGSACGGHSNAVGLRLYFDAVGRPAKFNFR